MGPIYPASPLSPSIGLIKIAEEYYQEQMVFGMNWIIIKLGTYIKIIKKKVNF